MRQPFDSLRHAEDCYIVYVQEERRLVEEVTASVSTPQAVIQTGGVETSMTQIEILCCSLAERVSRS